MSGSITQWITSSGCVSRRLELACMRLGARWHGFDCMKSKRLPLELTACRDAVLRECAIHPKSAPAVLPSWRQKLRITLIEEGQASLGSARLRLARALASAGHAISIVAVNYAP